jgi:hypothetical protein
VTLRVLRHTGVEAHQLRARLVFRQLVRSFGRLRLFVLQLYLRGALPLGMHGSALMPTSKPGRPRIRCVLIFYAEMVRLALILFNYAPFALSLSKGLGRAPFDRLRVNGLLLTKRTVLRLACIFQWVIVVTNCYKSDLALRENVCQ